MSDFLPRQVTEAPDKRHLLPLIGPENPKSRNIGKNHPFPRIYAVWLIESAWKISVLARHSQFSK